MIRRVLIPFILLFLTLLIGVAISQEPEKVSDKSSAELVFGYDAKLVREIGGSFNSIKIALDSFAQKINSRFALKWHKNTSEMIDALDEDKITCASIMALSYLFSEKKNIKPLVAAIASYSEDTTVRYVLVVRKDSGINTLEKLEGKIYAICKADEVGGLYVSTELAKNKLKSIHNFFDKTQLYDSQEEAFYSVYFKKSSATLISDDTLKMMMELNPAIKDQIHIICTSEKYIVGGLFVNVNINNDLEKGLIETSVNLHNTVSGRQTLKLVRMKKLQKMTDADFDGIRALLKEYKELTNTDYKEIYEKMQ